MLTNRSQTFFFAALLILFSSDVMSQIDTTDSLQNTTDSIRFVLDGRVVATHSLGYYAFRTSDEIGRHTYAGVSALNVLRGHVPHLTIGNGVAGVTAGLRNANSLTIVDGVAFSPSMHEFTNFNAFDFKTIIAVSSANGLVFYGGPGSNGALILETKSGKDIAGPQLEINSFSTFSKLDEVDGNLFQADKSQQWVFTNAVAYAQDFGTLDTRISYSGTFLPDGSTDSRTSSGRHSFRLNTGVEIGPSFSGRLTVDAHRTSSDENGNNDAFTEHFTKSNFNGNLILSFNAARWLSINSQSAFTNLTNERENVAVDYLRTEDSFQNRLYTNLFLLFSPHLSGVANVGMSVGGQINKELMEVNAETNFQDNSTIFHDVGEINSRSFMSQVNFGLKDFFYADLNARQEIYSGHFNQLFLDTNPLSYSANTAFIFSNAFKVQNKWLNRGKLRLSLGRSDYHLEEPFPYSRYIGFPSSHLNSIFADPLLQATEKTSREGGIDLVFLDSRMSLSATFFSDSYSNAHITFYELGVNRLDLGSYSRKGSEFTIAGIPLLQEKSRLTTKLIFSRFKTASTEVPKLEEYYHPGITPKWTASLLAQLNVENAFGSLLIDHHQNEPGYLYSRWYDYDLTGTWLRDLSVGYNFSSVSVSLSVRNMVQFSRTKHYSGLTELIDRNQKTISVSLMLRI